MSCRKQMVRANHSHILFEYNDFFRALLYRYKGQGDLALSTLFLVNDLKQLKRKYRGYTIVVVPSSAQDNFRRGFAFLPWIFQPLKLPMISPFYKQIEYKQSSSKNRLDIQNVICLKKHIYLKNKKLLIVDDVMTSGNTLKTCIKLLEPLQPKKIDF